ncbi:Asp-tRNA(Asn)/Glu-tRNA(Gln) amidotransferase subunit GatC [Fusobacterium simiae]|uniref:Aspartyl/glutamyl-tRNA(Asn/Gln) amidotransferase subunit C n=1 Tax=Fusobacterium simiae TaxID=855 RepID=A0ABT4DIV5_FUSSI|nr:MULTISPECIES: Asp-tRNA(Asn)/Glu-tRNA(Gln) amidotransferase subunit GatC [Fusobacterium]MCY7007386.1 Asp-tRNA(Asn)/Glu-tRNA(Gln) amidotransferase subunit GatC [Fusobacterium simiae]MDC7955841.1 Asp-tRNA(Asn)/Glu-tRNA(Gln) amidotransferase subunit GatC [Fusobacterium simiae]
MALTREEVLKIAKLSKLSFKEEEIEKFQVELNDILGYIDMLNEVDTSKVEPLVYINEAVNNFREKEEKSSLSIDKVLLNAPESAENAIVVPKVIGE